MECADFVATQNGYILAEGRIPAMCVRRVETCSVTQTGRRTWQQHRGWSPPDINVEWVEEVQSVKRMEEGERD
eukprot:2113156-Alexandrium_andersonii.AAC.1